jgi:hypothetical protein
MNREQQIKEAKVKSRGNNNNNDDEEEDSEEEF